MQYIWSTFIDVCGSTIYIFRSWVNIGIVFLAAHTNTRKPHFPIFASGRGKVWHERKENYMRKQQLGRCNRVWRKSLFALQLRMAKQHLFDWGVFACSRTGVIFIYALEQTRVDIYRPCYCLLLLWLGWRVFLRPRLRRIAWIRLYVVF